jgi:hypothetical protein
MPLTDELGGQALGILSARGRRLDHVGLGAGLNFEAWLSLLSQEQPQLTDADNRDNAAVFAHLRDAIAEALVAAQQLALSVPAPLWLYEFVAALHTAGAIVLTFNYDVLVEAAVSGHHLSDRCGRGIVRPLDVVGNLPPLPNVGARLGGPLCRTFRLLKLHGSLDFWAVPNDSTGATLNREDGSPTFGEPAGMSDEARRRDLPGRERFIVPPLSAKAGYYRNPLVRELWQQANQALLEATRLSILGYSVPVTDFVMASMLRGAIGRDIPVDVVDLRGDDVQKRLVTLGAVDERITVTAGVDCVSAFTAALCAEATAALIDRLEHLLPYEAADAALLVTWDPDQPGTQGHRVRALSVRPDGTVELIVEETNPPGGAMSARFDKDGKRSSESFPNAADLISAIRGCRRVVARLGESTHILVDSRLQAQNVGASARWLVFSPANPSAG